MRTTRATESGPLPHFPEPQQAESLGTSRPRLILYLPHQPNELEQLRKVPDARLLMDANSNHWRKIMTLLAKIAAPEADDWRNFRDESLFSQTALHFAPGLLDPPTPAWHWIGGQDNLARFPGLGHRAIPLPECPTVSIDADRRLLLTPYPDYRQLSNATVGHIRMALQDLGFYANP